MAKITVGATGDILLHQSILKRSLIKGEGYSFLPKLEQAKELFSSVDISIVNQESLAAGKEFGISSYPKFNSPIEILNDLKSLGVNVVNMANNHMLDKGEEGLFAAIKNIESTGLRYCGAYYSSEDPKRFEVVEKQGVKLGFISYTDGSKINTDIIKNLHVNWFSGESHAMRMNRRIAKIKKDVKDMKDKADIIIISLHFGEEYHRQPGGFQKDLVQSIAETGVDVIIGHHPHVLQPFRWIENSKGKEVLVAYSLGNFFSGQSGIHRQIGAFFSFDITYSMVNAGGLRSLAIENPVVDITYVDSRKDYKLFLLKNLVSQGKSIRINSEKNISAKKLHEKIASHLRADIDDLIVR